MSVIALRGCDSASEARALLNCVLRAGDIIGTDDSGGTALVLLLDPSILNRLLTFDAGAEDLEDAEGEAECAHPVSPPRRQANPPVRAATG